MRIVYTHTKISMSNIYKPCRFLVEGETYISPYYNFPQAYNWFEKHILPKYAHVDELQVKVRK